MEDDEDEVVVDFLSFKNHFKTLGLDLNATHAEIKAAIRLLRINCHPDKVQSAQAKENASRIFQDIRLAKFVLLDESRRQRYENFYRQDLDDYHSTFDALAFRRRIEEACPQLKPAEKDAPPTKVNTTSASDSIRLSHLSLGLSLFFLLLVFLALLVRRRRPKSQLRRKPFCGEKGGVRVPRLGRPQQRWARVGVNKYRRIHRGEIDRRRNREKVTRAMQRLAERWDFDGTRDITAQSPTSPPRQTLRDKTMKPRKSSRAISITATDAPTSDAATIETTTSSSMPVQNQTHVLRGRVSREASAPNSVLNRAPRSAPAERTRVLRGQAHKQK